MRDGHDRVEEREIKSGMRERDKRARRGRMPPYTVSSVTWQQVPRGGESLAVAR